MGDVVDLPMITTIDLDPQRVLAAAAKVDFDAVIIVGWKKDGDEFFSSSCSDGGDAVWLLERAKLKLLRIADEVIAKT